MFAIEDSEEITICKFIRHEFEWKLIDPEEKFEETIGKKKKKKMIIKGVDLDLRKYPFFLQDGDMIGVKLNSNDPTGTDDLQTD